MTLTYNTGTDPPLVLVPLQLLNCGCTPAHTWNKISKMLQQKFYSSGSAKNTVGCPVYSAYYRLVQKTGTLDTLVTLLLSIALPDLILSSVILSHHKLMLYYHVNCLRPLSIPVFSHTTYANIHEYCCDVCNCVFFIAFYIHKLIHSVKWR